MQKFIMTSRPKGITLIIILYSVFALTTGFVTFSTEKAGHLVEEQYGDQLKLYLFFDYDSDLAIITGGAEVLIFVGLIILLLNRSSKARIGVIGHALFSIGLIVVSLILPPAFFPQDHPSYNIVQSQVGDVLGLIISTLIIFYMFRSKTIQYFKFKKNQSEENKMDDESK